ncbi:2-oxo-4-hydroxy-4-carboxy-5-ureidoimidazoline decarboxylase [Candidatus Pelagibacter sp.]|nr:2-oxo-4-hydroxy-4-carboxy-5-ureidoimidazoline decarboxylase [Candidatus Pelagibacter sp.]
MDSIDKFNKLSKTEFISIFGNIFEKTEWIAKRCYESKPYNNLDELILKMMKIFENTEKEKHLEILNSHPDLAVEKKLTKDSKNEQKNASLNQCTDKEFIEFKKLNEEYKKKFGFPFIIAVKGKNKEEILNSFRQRITNNINLEFEEAKKQVKKIASFRLSEIIK